MIQLSEGPGENFSFGRGEAQETVPLDQAANAYAKMMAGKARFRMVLTMDRSHRAPDSSHAHINARRP
jgi:hypothetical protein